MTSETQTLLVITTCPDAQSAERVARALIDSRAAACVNVFASVRSYYRWKDELETASEQILLVKTTEAGYHTVSERIRAEHPYELPELIAVPIARGSEAYLEWLRENVNPTS